MSFSTGWFGIPGAGGRRSTLVHVVTRGKPACGTVLSKKQEFQWCTHGAYYSYLECEHCKKMCREGKFKEEKDAR